MTCDEIDKSSGSTSFAPRIKADGKIPRRTFGLNDNPYSGFTLNVLNLGACKVEVRD